MDTVNKPIITRAELNELELAVRENTARPEDYERLDQYVDFFFGRPQQIYRKLKEYGIIGYRDFIAQRKLNRHFVLSQLVGYVLGAISHLRRTVAEKLT